MLWVALAAQLSAPVPTNFRSWFSPDDFPQHVRAEGVTRVVFTRTTVRPDGSAQDCAPEASSGDAQVDAYTCGLILKRGKFQPATWIDGSAAFGIFRTPVTWAGSPSDNGSEEWNSSDAEVSVNRLPQGIHSPVWVRIQIAVDGNGKPEACGVAPNYPGFPPPPRENTNPQLLSMACEQTMKSFTAVPAKDSSGKAVASVQTMAVEFKIDH